MPAIQEKEKAFQSMQDSLDKIEKNTSSLGDLSESWRMTMEENKAQRLRDKEQEKQTKMRSVILLTRDLHSKKLLTLLHLANDREQLEVV